MYVQCVMVLSPQYMERTATRNIEINRFVLWVSCVMLLDIRSLVSNDKNGHHSCLIDQFKNLLILDEMIEYCAGYEI